MKRYQPALALLSSIGILVTISTLLASSPRGASLAVNEARGGTAIAGDMVTTGNFNLDGGWGYTMRSSASGETHVGSLTLKQDGSHVTGTFSAFDKSNPNLYGSYDPATGTLSLSRDTGLDTVQTFTLRRSGGKLTGTFRNKGRYPDSGTIELRRMTL
jgi:hypothetical protein